MSFALIMSAQAQEHTNTFSVASQPEKAHAQGLTLNPAEIGFHALNFLILLVLLSRILYKPLLKLLREREAKIKAGVENAEKAEILLKESNVSRVHILKEARAESQIMIESARQSGEQLRTEIITKAQEQAQQIIVAGKNTLDAERAKVLQEIKAQTVDLVITVTEKLLREKITGAKDAKLIKDSMESYSK